MRKALGLGGEGDVWDQPDGMGIQFEDDNKEEDVQMDVDGKLGNVSESLRVD